MSLIAEVSHFFTFSLSFLMTDSAHFRQTVLERFLKLVQLFSDKRRQNCFQLDMLDRLSSSDVLQLSNYCLAAGGGGGGGGFIH